MKNEAEEIKKASNKMIEGIQSMMGGVHSFLNSAMDKMTTEQKIEFQKALKDQKISEKASELNKELTDFKRVYNL